MLNYKIYIEHEKIRHCGQDASLACTKPDARNLQLRHIAVLGERRL